MWGQQGYEGSAVGLNVHHKTYERLGRERRTDLEVLCVYCHECEHGLNRRSRDEIRAKYTVPVLEWYDACELYRQQWDELISAAGF